MTIERNSLCTSFAGSRMIATGNLLEVAVQTKRSLDAGEKETILIFDDETSNQIEIDFRGQVEALKNRLNQQSTTAQPLINEIGDSTDSTNNSDRIESSARGRGRPKLGVVAREVTLLPRHWEWLNQQPGGASVALRKLVEDAKRANVYKDERRAAQDSTYRFISAMAGNQAGFEEATRALFAADSSRFFQKIESWPPDITAHVKKISTKALDISASHR
ncbi:DUF2239 family protein [soil metagenome]